MTPLPLANAAQALAQVDTLLFDLDDTFLTDGKLLSAGLQALEQLAAAGIQTWVLTGRSLGLAEILAWQWPIAGAIAENGAVATRQGGSGLERWDPVSAAERDARSRLLATQLEAIQQAFPQAHAAEDNHLRLTDRTVAIDATTGLSPAAVAEMQQWLRDRGMRTVASSVHLHLSYDDATKGTGALAALAHWQGRSAAEVCAAAAFIGDSENDAAAFATFPHSFGVANLRVQSATPRYITTGRATAGFVELAHLLRHVRGH